MKKCIIKSTHLKEINKWYPSGFLRKPIMPGEFNDIPISFSEVQFDTKDGANNYLKIHLMGQGYKENEIEIK